MLRVEGFSLDYLVLNITGYGLYTIYSTVGYFTDIPGAGTVVIADLVFVYHGVLMVTIQVYQVWKYEVTICLYLEGTQYGIEAGSCYSVRYMDCGLY